MTFLHTMLRVGDLQRSIDFYTANFGMTLRRTVDRPEQQYTLAYLGFGAASDDAMGEAEVELTYNYGVSVYEPGTAFGHLAFGMPDVTAVCERVRAHGGGGKVTREPGPVKGGSTFIAFVQDPDGYKIELIQHA